MKNHANIAIRGNNNTQFSGCNNINPSKILLNAHATQKTL